MSFASLNGQRTQLEDTPISCSHVCANRQRLDAQVTHCTWRRFFFHDCFLAHRLNTKLSKKFRSNAILNPILKCNLVTHPVYPTKQNMASQLVPYMRYQTEVVCLWRSWHSFLPCVGSIHSSGDHNLQPIESRLKTECGLRNKANKEHLEPTRADKESRVSGMHTTD